MRSYTQVSPPYDDCEISNPLRSCIFVRRSCPTISFYSGWLRSDESMGGTWRIDMKIYGPPNALPVPDAASAYGAYTLSLETGKSFYIQVMIHSPLRAISVSMKADLLMMRGTWDEYPCYSGCSARHVLILRRTFLASIVNRHRRSQKSVALANAR